MKSDELQAPKHHKKCGGHFPSGAAKIVNYDPETKRRRKKKIESEQPIEETSRRNGAFRDRVSLFHTFSHFVCCCFVFLSLSLSLSIPVLSSFQEPLHWYGFDTIVLHIPFSDICFETSPVVAGWNHRIPLPPTTKKILWTFNFF